MSCEQLVPGFMALNQLKRSGDLCRALPQLQGFNHACNSALFGNELDRRALCELFCCCMDAERQECVKKVLFAADGFHGFKGFYKAEAPFLNGNPVMSRSQPERPTRGRPGGSRIPDVVVVKDNLKPPTMDNIQKVYEMKFPGDTYSNRVGPDEMTQQKAYSELFGNKIDKDPMDAESCQCQERKKERVLERAAAFQAEKEKALSLVDRVNADTGKAAVAAALATGAGRLVDAVGGAAASVARWLLVGP